MTAVDSAHLIQEAFRLWQAGQRQEALALAARATATVTATSDPRIHDSLGTLLTHLEQPEHARTHFDLAVRQSPDNVGFRYNLAMAQRMCGDLEAAESNLDEVIRTRPGDGEAYHVRSGLRRQSAERNHVGELERALRALDGRRAAIPVAYALAKELEDLGEFARSFAILQGASRFYRASLRYDVAADVAVLEKLRATHTKERIRSLQSACDNDEPNFIIGLPRSGTTLVERILGSHSAVYPAGEIDAFQGAAIRAVGRLGPATTSARGTAPAPPTGKLAFVDRLLEVDYTGLGTSYIAATRPRTGRTRQFTDKFPSNYLYAGAISAALPRARFIALRRNPMDSCFAMYKTLFAGAYPFTYDLLDLGRYFVAWHGLMQHWEAVLGNALLTVSYEELVSDQEAVSRRMIAHCGLPWEPGCLTFHSAAGPVSTASAAQVRSPLYRDSVGKWLHHADALEPLAQHLRAHGIHVDSSAQ